MRPRLGLQRFFEACQPNEKTLFDYSNAVYVPTLLVSARKVDPEDDQDYYTAHGEDAKYIAQEVYHTSSVIKLLGSKSAPLPSVTLSITLAKEFLRDALSVKQLRIEIWIPEGGKKSASKFVLNRQASPGNIQEVEDLIFANTEITSPPIVLALRVSQLDGVRTLGTAFADASIRKIGVSQFAENDLFSNIEVCVVI
ncbi:MutS-like protein [Serendipita sp. 396]|nr:MutS-like protein [Serendipita sp. 396]